MKVVTISATAGRKFSHPTESFGNMLVSATFTAELETFDDEVKAARDLQRMADAHADAAKAQALDNALQQPQWSPTRAQTATEDKAASLAAKHKGK